MGNPNQLPDEHEETFEGRPIDPRFEKGVDPFRDPRFNTNLNPATVPPKNLGGEVRILAIVLGLILFALVIALMYWKFQTPAPRSPEDPRSSAAPIVFADANNIG
jgi:hypothetical protein